MNMFSKTRFLYGCLCVLALASTGYSEAQGKGPKPDLVGVGEVVGKTNAPGVGELDAKEVGTRPAGSKLRRRGSGGTGFGGGAEALLGSMTNACWGTTPWSKFRYEKCLLSCECLSSCCGSDGTCNLSIFSQGIKDCKSFFK